MIYTWEAHLKQFLRCHWEAQMQALLAEHPQAPAGVTDRSRLVIRLDQRQWRFNCLANSLEEDIFGMIICDYPSKRWLFQKLLYNLRVPLVNPSQLSTQIPGKKNLTVVI